MKCKSLTKSLVIYLTALVVVLSNLGNHNKVEAANLGQTLVYSAAALTYINGQLNNLNDNHQKELLQQSQRRTGVYGNEEANAIVDSVARRLMSNGIIKGNYAVYVTPDKSFNAFCSLGRIVAVHRGAVEFLDIDELAAIMGHEMAHGEHKDSVEGIKKSIGLGVIVNLYLQNNPNLTSKVISGAAGNYISNEVFTMEQEWKADNSGFANAVAAGYNPGGGAASMVKLRAQYGELWHEGLSKIVNPNNHPKTTDRVNNFAKHLTNFSKGHITVKNDKIVQINGQDVVTPVKAFQHMAEERSYLIAGNLAKVYHNNTLSAAYVGDDGTVYIGDQIIMTPADNDLNGQEIADRINSITGQ